MKRSNNINFLSSGIILLSIFAFAYSNAQQRPLELIENSHLIDSLIVVEKINDKTLLITFGSDAITAINTQKGIIVIDAGISTGLTLKFRKIIEKEFQSDAFKYVINTHSHVDHYGGNSVFKEAEVIGHENGFSEIMTQWNDTTKVINSIAKIVNEYEIQLQECRENTNEWIEVFTQKMRYYNAMVDAQSKDLIINPTLAFSDSLKIDMGDLRFEMIFFGKCHSNSDILIYLPELKILFSGDLFFKYGRPSVNNKLIEDKDKWQRSVKWIEKRIPDIETIISGHGKIFTPEDLKSFKQIILAKLN